MGSVAGYIVSTSYDECVKKMTTNSKKQRRKISPGTSPPGFLLWLWPLIDKIISKLLNINPLRGDEGGILGIELRWHKGQPVQLDDGTIIMPGDTLIELHLNGNWFLNNRPKQADSTREQRWKVSSAVISDLAYLAKQIAGEKLHNKIKALHGSTLLYLPAQRLGFDIRERPQGFHRFLTTFYLSGLSQVYYFGERSVKTRTPPILKEVWMSRSKLLALYLRQ